MGRTYGINLVSMAKSKYFIAFFVLVLLTACQNKQEPQIQNITADQMMEAIEFESIQLIDVRTPSEFKKGRLKSAENICLINDDFKSKAQLLDKNKPVYLYCKSGKRSAKAAETLKEMGFKIIYEMSGGIDDWKEKEFDTEES